MNKLKAKIEEAAEQDYQDRDLSSRGSFIAGSKFGLKLGREEAQCLVEALERQVSPHIEEFCRQRAYESLAQYKKAIADE